MKSALAAAALALVLSALGALPAQAAAGSTVQGAGPGFEVAKSVKKRPVGKKPGKAKKTRAASGRK
jgi:hypothetical protein